MTKGKLNVCEGGVLMFFCPSCDCYHGANPTWRFDGDFENPTFEPSFRSTGGGIPEGQSCHLNVTRGQLVFHDDHFDERFRGKTVPMEEA